MMKKILIIFLPFLLLSCNGINDESKDIVVGVGYNFNNLDPIYSFNKVESNISSLLNLSLLGHRWNFNKGNVEFYNQLADTIKWNVDSTEVYIKLKNILWEDSTSVTSYDVVKSFLVYSDKKIGSKYTTNFKNYFFDGNKIDSSKTFNIIDDYRLKITFKRTGSYFDIDFPISKRTTLEKINLESILKGNQKINIVSNSPYEISNFKKGEFLVLSLRKNHPFAWEKSPRKIIFKFIPTYETRIAELKKGSIDICEDILPENISELINSNNINIQKIEGREFLFLAINNNKEFLNKSDFRHYLNSLITKKELLKDIYLNEGLIANSVVSPLFNIKLDDKNYLPEKVTPIEKELSLILPFGDRKRELIAEKLKNWFMKGKIKLEVEKLEPSVFGQRIMQSNYDLALMIFGVPIPHDFKIFWHSNKNIGIMNLWNYKNSALDSILEDESKQLNEKQIRQINDIVMNDLPVIPLIWLNSNVAINKKVKNIKVSPLGAISRSWEWEID